MSNQRTSGKPVSDGLAKQVGRMVEDASLKYPGGTAKLELVKGDPGFTDALYQFFDERAAKRAETMAVTDRPPFKTVKLGTHDSNEALRKEILGAGCKIGDWGLDILKRVEVAKEPTEIDIIVLTVAELGFPNGATCKDIYAKALSLGLQLCPAEVGPQLRLQYMDQPKGEWILIGMEPITDSDGNLKVFNVEHDGSVRWLRGIGGNPVNFWVGYDRWAFRRK